MEQFLFTKYDSWSLSAIKTEKSRQTAPKKRKIYSARQNAVLRGLGYIPLNSPKEGCIGHHIDESLVIYIPDLIHRKHKHSLKNPESMILINKIAFDYLFGISHQIKFI